MSNPLQKVESTLRASELMSKAEVLLERLEAIAKERCASTGGDFEAVLKAAFEEAGKGTLQENSSYKEILDAMRNDVGADYFDKLLLNPNFKAVLDEWKSNFAKQQLGLICSRLSAWSEGKLTPEEFRTVVLAIHAADYLDKQ